MPPTSSPGAAQQPHHALPPAGSGLCGGQSKPQDTGTEGDEFPNRNPRGWLPPDPPPRSTGPRPLLPLPQQWLLEEALGLWSFSSRTPRPASRVWWAKAPSVPLPGTLVSACFLCSPRCGPRLHAPAHTPPSCPRPAPWCWAPPDTDAARRLSQPRPCGYYHLGGVRSLSPAGPRSFVQKQKEGPCCLFSTSPHDREPLKATH